MTQDDGVRQTLRVLTTLKYDGSGFFGWAKQPGKRTVQEELEAGLAKLFGGAVPTVVGGRTDTGVHAKGQRVHFDVDAERWEKLKGHQKGWSSEHSLLMRLRGVLPIDIVVYGAQVVEIPAQGRNDEEMEDVAPDKQAGFSARFSAIRRTYKYRLCDSLELLDPNRNDVVYSRSKLDVDKMAQASRTVVGLHDFATFAKARETATTIRDLQKFIIRRVNRFHVLFGLESASDLGLIVATLTADAFAHNMVRSLIGACLLIGKGERNPDWLKECLDGQTREGATGPTKPEGLTLERIDYPRSASKAAKRAAQIRARRSL